MQTHMQENCLAHGVIDERTNQYQSWEFPIIVFYGKAKAPASTVLAEL